MIEIQNYGIRFPAIYAWMIPEIRHQPFVHLSLVTFAIPLCFSDVHRFVLNVIAASKLSLAFPTVRGRRDLFFFPAFGTVHSASIIALRSLDYAFVTGSPGGIRTHDFQLRRLALYSAELRD